jgi:hypothetical protein
MELNACDRMESDGKSFHRHKWAGDGGRAAI